MRVEQKLSPELKRLALGFRAWRRGKQHVRERIPDALMQQARRAIPAHGSAAVARAIEVEHARLVNGPRQRTDRRPTAPKGGAPATAKPPTRPAKPAKAALPPVPSYSRLEFPAPSASSRPIAEVETPVGLKLKVFEVTPETMSLLSALAAGGRVP